MSDLEVKTVYVSVDQQSGHVMEYFQWLESAKRETHIANGPHAAYLMVDERTVLWCEEEGQFYAPINVRPPTASDINKRAEDTKREALEKRLRAAGFDPETVKEIL